MAEATKPDPQADPAASVEAAGAGTGAETGAANADTGKITLTQAELDAIVLSRTDQARRKATENADAAKKWAEYQLSQQSDAEKSAAKTKAEEDRLAALAAKTNSRAIAAEVRLVAVEKGVRKEALSLVAQLLAENESITVGDDGEVSGAEAAVNKLLTEHKYLLSEKPAAGKSGAEFSGEDAKTQADKIKAAEAAKKPGESIALKMQQLASGG
jgi:hypothetical protein